MLARLRGIRSDRVSGLALVALALFVAWENRAYPIGTLQEPGPGYMPLLIAAFLGLVGVLVAVAGGRSTPFAEIRWPEATRAVMILGGCVFAILALERIGYRLTVIALLVFFLGVVERKKPWRVAAVAIGFSLISFYLIAIKLHVPLPRGPGGF